MPTGKALSPHAPNMQLPARKRSGGPARHRTRALVHLQTVQPSPACSGCCMKTPPAAFLGPQPQAEARRGEPGHLKRKCSGHTQTLRPHTDGQATHKCAGHTQPLKPHTDGQATHKCAGHTQPLRPRSPTQTAAALLTCHTPCRFGPHIIAHAHLGRSSPFIPASGGTTPFAPD